MKNWWKTVQDILRVLRPCWLAALLVTAIAIALQIAQTKDALVSIAVDSDFLSGLNFSLFLSILVLAFSGWYFSRALLYVRYWFTPPDPEDRFEPWRRWVPRILGALPIFSLVGAYLRGNQFYFAVFYFLIALLFIVVLVIRRSLMLPAYAPVKIQLHDKMPRRTFWSLVVLLTIAFILLWVFIASPVVVPQMIGPVGIVLIAAAIWLAGGSMILVYPTYRYRLPSLVIVVLLLAVIFSLWNDNHKVRTGTAEAGPWVRQSVTRQLDGWLKHRRKSWRECHPDGKPFPIFIAATEGGGIRAAYWTASVLAHLEDTRPGFACHLFAISGVSGGSLGGSVFAALIADLLQTTHYACDTCVNESFDNLLPKARNILAQDFLGPVLAGMLFPDFMQRFSPFSDQRPFSGALAFPDRAKYLELAWEHAWEHVTGSGRFRENFRRLWQPDTHRYRVPSLFLNGTWVDNGERNVTCNLSPESPKFVMLEDAVPVLNHPINLSTAVHMSARFTYVSPAGTIRTPQQVRHVVDGGYFENSGAMTAAEIVTIIKEFCGHNDVCAELGVIPVVLVISNDPDNRNQPDLSRRTPKSVSNFLLEILAPVRTLLNTRAARGYHAENFLKEAAGADHTIRFQLTKTGAETIPLGWMLSGETRQQMDDQLVVLSEPVERVVKLLETGK